MLEALLFVLVGATIAVLLLIWVVGLIRKVGGCLIHLALAAAALLLLVYLGWLFLQRFLQT